AVQRHDDPPERRSSERDGCSHGASVDSGLVFLAPQVLGGGSATELVTKEDAPEGAWAITPRGVSARPSCEPSPGSPGRAALHHGGLTERAYVRYESALPDSSLCGRG